MERPRQRPFRALPRPNDPVMGSCIFSVVTAGGPLGQLVSISRPNATRTQVNPSCTAVCQVVGERLSRTSIDVAANVDDYNQSSPMLVVQRIEETRLIECNWIIWQVKDHLHYLTCEASSPSPFQQERGLPVVIVFIAAFDLAWFEPQWLPSVHPKSLLPLLAVRAILLATQTLLRSYGSFSVNHEMYAARSQTVDSAPKASIIPTMRIMATPT